MLKLNKLRAANQIPALAAPIIVILQSQLFKQQTTFLVRKAAGACRHLLANLGGLCRGPKKGEHFAPHHNHHKTTKHHEKASKKGYSKN
jgi:hypothetical protein